MNEICSAQEESDVQTAWRQLRLTGIGASEAAAAVGISPWITPYQLYRIKTGEDQHDAEQSNSAYWGSKLEPIVRQEYSNRTGRTVVVTPFHLERHDQYPFMICTPDGLVGDDRLYEGKTASFRQAQHWGESGSLDVPLDYMIQVQHAMFVTHRTVCDLAVLIGGNDYRQYEIPADQHLQTMLVEQERDFWNSVQQRTPPPPENKRDLLTRWPHGSGRAIVANNELVQACATMRDYQQARDNLNLQLGLIKFQIQTFMQDAHALYDTDGHLLATWKDCKPPSRFNTEQFALDHPDLYRQYLTQATEPQRRFLLKDLPSTLKTSPAGAG